jgi:hypothetical protein
MFNFQKLDKVQTKKGGFMHTCYCKETSCLLKVFTPSDVPEIPDKAPGIRVFGYADGALQCSL